MTKLLFCNCSSFLLHLQFASYPSIHPMCIILHTMTPDVSFLTSRGKTCILNTHLDPEEMYLFLLLHQFYL